MIHFLYENLRFNLLIPTFIAIDAPGGFLFEWWSVFWDIFIARTNEKHSEAAAAYIEVWLNLRNHRRHKLLKRSFMAFYIKFEKLPSIVDSTNESKGAAASTAVTNAAITTHATKKCTVTAKGSKSFPHWWSYKCYQLRRYDGAAICQCIGNENVRGTNEAPSVHGLGDIFSSYGPQ